MMIAALLGPGLGLLGREVTVGSTAAICSVLGAGHGDLIDPATLCLRGPRDPVGLAVSQPGRVAGRLMLPVPQFGGALEVGEPPPADTVPDELEPGAGVDSDHAGLTEEPAISLSRGGLTLSAGYSTVERFRLKAQLTRNFAESGRQISATVSYSALRWEAAAGLSATPFLGKRTSFSATAFALRERALGFTDDYGASPFEQRAVGAEVGLSHAVSRSFSVFTSLRLAREEFRLSQRGQPCDAAIYTGIVCGELGRGNRAEWALSLALDRRDSPVDPRHGYRLHLGERIVARRGSLQYLKSEAGFERHVQYGEEWSIATTVEGGVITKLGGTGAPVFDRFYLGGQSLRGFDLRGVAPRLTASAPAGALRASVGGTYFYTARAELVGHVGGYLGRNELRPSMYIEAGSAFGLNRARLLPGETLEADSAAPRIAIGIGVRWPTPIGSVRFDFSLPLVSRKGDREQVFSLSVGL